MLLLPSKPLPRRHSRFLNSHDLRVCKPQHCIARLLLRKGSETRISFLHLRILPSLTLHFLLLLLSPSRFAPRYIVWTDSFPNDKNDIYSHRRSWLMWSHSRGGAGLPTRPDSFVPLTALKPIDGDFLADELVTLLSELPVVHAVLRRSQRSRRLEFA